MCVCVCVFGNKDMNHTLFIILKYVGNYTS